MNWNDLWELFTKTLFTVGQTPVSMATLVWGILMFVLIALLSRFTRRLLRTRVLVHTRMDVGLQYLISRIAGYVVLVLGVIVGLQTMGINLSALAVVAGALGVGIGFGLQNVVHNFVSGLILMGERSIQIGDRVEVGGTTGVVERIGARSTSIRTNDNIILIVPNSDFVSNPVVNWSYLHDHSVRFRIPVGVSYKSDPHLVERLLMEVAAANEHVLKSPAPNVVMKGFGDSSVDFELRAWTTELTHRPSVFKSELLFAIWDKFKEHGIEIPFPQRDLHIKSPVQIESPKE